MDELISRKALLEAYDKAHQGPPGGARKLIEDAPAIDIATHNNGINVPSMWLYGYIESLPENSPQRIAVVNMLIKHILEQEDEHK